MIGDNALLLEITAPASMQDDYGDTETTVGQTLWAGQASCHLQRLDRRVVSGGLVTQVRSDSLVVRTSEAPAIELGGDEAHGYTVLVQDNRTSTPVTRRFTVAGVENRAAGTIADSVRLELEVTEPGG